MEPEKKSFTPTDIQFHSRAHRPTMSFEQAVKKAQSKSSKEIRIYGQPVLEIDIETGLVYLRHYFSKDVIEKMNDGTLPMSADIPSKIDAETQQKIADKKKRELKNSTRVWHKRK